MRIAGEIQQLPRPKNRRIDLDKLKIPFGTKRVEEAKLVSLDELSEDEMAQRRKQTQAIKEMYKVRFAAFKSIPGIPPWEREGK